MKCISSESYNQFSSFPHGILKNIDASDICDGVMGECIHEDMHRRNLAGSKRYISYDALKQDSIPCKHRGNSYYGCGAPGKANPYSRGCSKITNCERITD